MPTIITHSVLSIFWGKFYSRINSWKFWALSIICSVIPDADVLAFNLGIPYGNMFGHRGFSHSLLFAFILALLVVYIAFRNIERYSKLWWSLVFYFFSLTATHSILDALTNGGLGVGFFIPFDSTRYFFAYTPIKVASLGYSRFFSASGMQVLLSEILWIWIPLGIILIVVNLIRKRKSVGVA
jgi:inner membrane protein